MGTTWLKKGYLWLGSMVVFSWVLPQKQSLKHWLWCRQFTPGSDLREEKWDRKEWYREGRNASPQGAISGAWSCWGASEEPCRMHLGRDHLREPKKGVFIYRQSEFSLECLTPLHFQGCPWIRLAAEDGAVSNLYLWSLGATATAGVKTQAERTWWCPRGVLYTVANIQLKREAKRGTVWLFFFFFVHSWMACGSFQSTLSLPLFI